MSIAAFLAGWIIGVFFAGALMIGLLSLTINMRKF